ncbi:hypothetical protein FEF65_02735 [Mariprofundus erugo]|uniref:Uncharacterized protein n=1 Tax=Mariprofundus erugo TaxID=2528639 RepID=A0A5R9GUY6_9PROT|nr:hypothetical protein [Mariprofundus erugo]TLS68639.1 hypothetical protein FEF65_02735 [Mariprofundus erugo]
MPATAQLAALAVNMTNDPTMLVASLAECGIANAEQALLRCVLDVPSYEPSMVSAGDGFYPPEPEEIFVAALTVVFGGIS